MQTDTKALNTENQYVVCHYGIIFYSRHFEIFMLNNCYNYFIAVTHVEYNNHVRYDLISQK